MDLELAAAGTPLSAVCALIAVVVALLPVFEVYAYDLLDAVEGTP